MCSVDPPGCRDIDDALSVREVTREAREGLSGVDIRAGVHIADVTSFLKPETAMDDEAKGARRRRTSSSAGSTCSRNRSRRTYVPCAEAWRG